MEGKMIESGSISSEKVNSLMEITLQHGRERALSFVRSIRDNVDRLPRNAFGQINAGDVYLVINLHLSTLENEK